MDESLLLVGDLILFAGMPAIVLFTVLYGFRSKWREVLAGRSLFYMALSLTAIVLLAVWSRLSSIFDWPMPFREWVRMGVYTFTSLSLWRMVATLIRYQRLDREKKTREVSAKNMDDPRPEKETL